MIAFGWQDLEIVNGAPAARRNFIDGFAARLHPNHVPTLLRFRQVLARRNRLLQQYPHDTGRLAPWTEQFAAVGMELLGRRRKAVAALQTEIARVYGSLAGTAAKVEVRYVTALGEAAEPEALVAALERRHREEARRGQTLVGPHRDDLRLLVQDLVARGFASHGETWGAALCLRLAMAGAVNREVGEPPILFLDDPFSALDPERRGRMAATLGTRGQVVLAVPDEAQIPPGAAVWRVKEGRVVAE